MKTTDFNSGDKIKIKNSIECTIMEITKNGWLNCCWLFINKKRILGLSDREMEINSFRASDVEYIIKKGEKMK